MTTYQSKITLLALALATSICGAQEDPRRLVDEPSDKRTLGYGTSGIAEEVEDPGLGSRSTFGGGAAPISGPAETNVADDEPRGILDEPGERKTMGYGTSGIAEEVEDPGLGSRSTFGGGAAPISGPAETNVADDEPRGILDEPGERKTMGYGTSGIAEEVEDPGLGSRSMFGKGQDAGEAPTGD